MYDPSYLTVLTTVPDKSTSRAIIDQLLQQHVAASVQVLGPVESHYWWKGKIERAEEWLCVIKTTKARYAIVETIIIEHHPYDIPEIIALPIVAGKDAYLTWISRYASA